MCAFLKQIFLQALDFFISLIAITLNVSDSSLKGKFFSLVSESNKEQGFKCSWAELSSWVDWSNNDVIQSLWEEIRTLGYL